MTTVIIVFIILSVLTSVIVVAACAKSSQITRWENAPEAFEAELVKKTPQPKISRTAVTL